MNDLHNTRNERILFVAQIQEKLLQYVNPYTQHFFGAKNSQLIKEQNIDSTYELRLSSVDRNFR